MAEAFVDRVDELSADEEDGVIKRVTRRVRVVGLTDTSYQVLFSALEEAGVPAYGDLLPGAPNLFLRRRSPRLVEGEPGVVDVDLVYEHTATSQGQSIDDPVFGVLLGEVDATVNSVKANKDVFGQLFQLSHTYPEDDPDFPGEPKIQGGEVEFLQPQTTFSFRGVRTTTAPWLEQRFLLSTVNATDWSGYGPEEVLCTRVGWRPIDGETGKFEFTYVFQHNPDGWNPTIVFIDERTGKPPPNLVEGIGYKKVTMYLATDFENAFGVRSQGG